jgi:hypothetical protein
MARSEMGSGYIYVYSALGTFPGARFQRFNAVDKVILKLTMFVNN